VHLCAKICSGVFIQEFWFMFIHRKKENKEVSPAVSLTPNPIRGSVTQRATWTSANLNEPGFLKYFSNLLSNF